jgi:ribose 5-phosphate isomerase B
MLYIASDHGGFKLKEEIKQFLADQNIQFQDLGPVSFDPADDYPDYAQLVAEKVSSDPLGSSGILLCRSGQGVNIVANKFKHVRAALVWNTKEAQASRGDDLANVLSLPTDYISSDTAKDIVSAWLATPLGTEDRHVRRVQKISDLEGELFKG